MNLLTSYAVYLECRARLQDKAVRGAESILKLICHEWMNDPQLDVESKFQSLFA